jgi:hypothetical protein
VTQQFLGSGHLLGPNRPHFLQCYVFRPSSRPDAVRAPQLPRVVSGRARQSLHPRRRVLPSNPLRCMNSRQAAISWNLSAARQLHQSFPSIHPISVPWRASSRALPSYAGRLACGPCSLTVLVSLSLSRFEIWHGVNANESLEFPAPG